jgi:rubrerythrin
MSGRSLWGWVADATPYEALSFALRMEQGALRRYTRMAGQAASRLAGAKLRYLAEEEREHARLLGRAIRGLARPGKLRRTPISRAEVAGFPEGDTPEASLRLALKAEKDSETFYRRCAARCRKAAARKLFEALAGQESRHARLLQDELVLLGGGFAWRSLEGAPPPEEDFWA